MVNYHTQKYAVNEKLQNYTVMEMTLPSRLFTVARIIVASFFSRQGIGYVQETSPGVWDVHNMVLYETYVFRLTGKKDTRQCLKVITMEVPVGDPLNVRIRYGEKEIEVKMLQTPGTLSVFFG